MALNTGSASRRQHASMSACSCSSEPNNFTLPLISSNKALGGSMLTKEVNCSACRQSLCSTAGSLCANSGNTAAYHSCLERGRAFACALGGGGSTDTGSAVSGRLAAAANKSAVRDFAERNFKDHPDPRGRAGRLVL